jgi:DNA-binding MarR family transcriptional regulator
MSAKDLSPNERVVFHALVRHPTLNDRELSERVQVKLSTVTAIKNRLKARGFFFTIQWPQLQHLGCELLTVNLAMLNSSVPQNTRIDVGQSLVGDFPETFYLAADERAGFGLSLNRNYSAARSNTERFFRVFSEREVLLPEGYRAIYFPFGQSRVYNTFECANLLAHDFGIGERDERPHGRERAVFETVRSVDLSRIEKRVYRGIVANPDFHDSSVAKQIDVTRQTVTKIRRRFESLGLVRTLRVPNLAALGYEVLVLFHEHYRPNAQLVQRREKEETFFAKLPVVFRVASDLESLEVMAFHDFSEYLRTAVALSKFNREHRFIAREPDQIVFALRQLYTIKNHVYAGTVDRALGTDEA